MSRRVTIFLDIDGVLHPNTVGELEYGPNGPVVTGLGVCALQTKLAERVRGKAVDIAIHSTWIYMFDLKRLHDEYLRELSAADLPPTNRASRSLVKFVFGEEDEHEEALYGTANHRVSEGSRGRYAGQGTVQEAWVQ